MAIRFPLTQRSLEMEEAWSAKPRSWVIPPGSYAVSNPTDMFHVVTHRLAALVRITINQPMLRAFREAVGIPSMAGAFDFYPPVQIGTPELQLALNTVATLIQRSPQADGGGTWPLRLQGALFEVLSGLWETHPCQLRDRLARLGIRKTLEPRLHHLFSYFQAHVAEPCPSGRVAQAVGMSVPNLYRLCRQELKCTPMEFLTRLRVERAESLMRNQRTWDWRKVALACGYRSPWGLKLAFNRVRGSFPKL